MLLGLCALACFLLSEHKVFGRFLLFIETPGYLLQIGDKRWDWEGRKELETWSSLFPKVKVSIFSPWPGTFLVFQQEEGWEGSELSLQELRIKERREPMSLPDSRTPGMRQRHTAS